MSKASSSLSVSKVDCSFAATGDGGGGGRDAGESLSLVVFIVVRGDEA